MNILDAIENPILYSFIFFIYVILSVIILPVPVEIGLFNPNVHPAVLIFILALGKGVGSFFVFTIGAKVRKGLKRFSFPIKAPKWFMEPCERFVMKYGYLGIFLIMSLPLMLDSVTLYLFSLLNPEKNGMVRNKFVLVNIASGAVRGIIVFTFTLFALNI